MVFLLSLFFGICVFALVCMLFQHYGLVHEAPRLARTEPAPATRLSPSNAKSKKSGFSLFGALAGAFASLRGKKGSPKDTAPVTPLGVNPTTPVLQPVLPLGLAPEKPSPQSATPLGVAPVPSAQKAATDTQPKEQKLGLSPQPEGAAQEIRPKTEAAAPVARPKTEDVIAAAPSGEPEKEPPGIIGKAALPAAAGLAAAGLAVSAARKEAASEPTGAPRKATPAERDPKRDEKPPEPPTAAGRAVADRPTDDPGQRVSANAPGADMSAESAPAQATGADEPLTTITTLRGSSLAIKPCKTDVDFVPYAFERIYTQPARLSSFTVLYFLQANGYTDSVIEIGIAPVEDGVLQKATSFFVRPPYNDFNSRKTRLTLEDVTNSPTFAELWPTIEGYIRENVVAVYGATVHLACLFSSLAHYGIETPDFVSFDIKETVQGLQGDAPGKDDLVSLAKKGEVPLDKDNAKDCAVFAARLQLAAIEDNPKLENRLMLFADRATVMEQMADGALAPESAEKESRKLLAETEGKTLAESLPALAAVEGALLYAPNAELAETCAAFHEQRGDAKGAAALRELAQTNDPTEELIDRIQRHLADLAQSIEKGT